MPHTLPPNNVCGSRTKKQPWRLGQGLPSARCIRMTWPGVAGCSGPAAGSAPHTRRPRIGVVHPMAEHVVEEDRDLARRCGDRLGLADAGRQTAVEGAQRRRRGPTAAAASRSSAAARLPERRVRADSTLPPEILLWGARLSHDVKCLALGHAARLVPHSPTNVSAGDGPIPSICVTSTPRIACRASRTAKPGSLACCRSLNSRARLGWASVPVENNGPRVDEAAGRRGGQSAMMIKSIIGKQVGLASIGVVEQLSCERHDWRAFDMRAGAANPVQHHEIEGWNSSEQGMGRQYRLTSPIVGSCDIGVRNSRKRIAYDLELRINDLLGSIKTESQSPPTDVQALHELL